MFALFWKVLENTAEGAVVFDLVEANVSGKIESLKVCVEGALRGERRKLTNQGALGLTQWRPTRKEIPSVSKAGIGRYALAM